MKAGLRAVRRTGRRVAAGVRTRILAAYIVLLVLSTGVGLVAMHELLHADASERVDDSLVQETREFSRLVRLGRNPQTGRPFRGDVRAMFDVFLSRNVTGEREEFFTFVDGRLYRATLDVELRSPEGLDLIAAIGRATGRGEVDAPRGRLRYMTVPVIVDGRRRGVFAVANRFEGEQDEVSEAFRVASVVSLGVVALASLLAWLVAGRVLAPLRSLSETAHSIGESDLTRRIAVEGNDELAELARTFNAMLGRLEAAFESQKWFIGDAGHELRTPITVVRGHLEVLGDDPEERRETIELVTDELERMARMVDELSLLAKAQRPDFIRREPIDLDALTRRLFAKASALAPRAWSLDPPGNGQIEADPQRLTEAVLNLAQNAVEHTDESDGIELGARLADGHVRLWVRDSGPGVDPAERERIFERFGRGGGAVRRRDGSGLGLAITRAIAEAHGGRIELDSRPGRGATFTLSIPVNQRGR